MNSIPVSNKLAVKDFWERYPCGAGEAPTLKEGSPEFFESIERYRYSSDDFMHRAAEFHRWAGKKVLEVGCGMGIDLLQFAKGGAEIYGIDITEKGILLARQGLSIAKCRGFLCVGDTENLPFGSDHFDLAYAWGVIHHTSDPQRAVQEIYRVLKPGGKVIVMLYHRHSLVALQVWLYYGLGRARPWLSPSQIIAGHMESPGTKVMSRQEARNLFSGWEKVEVQPIVTRYDVRLGRRFFLPAWVRKFIPSSLGWFLVIKANKRVV